MSRKGDALPRSVSTVAIDAGCQPPADLSVEEKDDVLSVQLVVPITLVLGMMILVGLMWNDMREQLMRNPEANPVKQVWIIGPVFFSVFYLQVVYFGQRFMADKKPLCIKPFVFTYNLYQCLLNLVTVGAMCWEVYTNPHYTSVWGNAPQRDAQKGFAISFLVWLHYNNKFVELLDTFWMVLKKKDKQISFLHCYHHILLIWVWWYCCRVEPTGESWFGACVNSFIHVIMYGYYTMALLNIPCPWKRWITNCQMLQFAVCLTHAGYVFYRDEMPRGLSYAQAWVMVNMLYLFGRFYAESYGQKKSEGGKGDKKDQ